MKGGDSWTSKNSEPQARPYTSLWPEITWDPKKPQVESWVSSGSGGWEWLHSSERSKGNFSLGKSTLNSGGRKFPQIKSKKYELIVKTKNKTRQTTPLHTQKQGTMSKSQQKQYSENQNYKSFSYCIYQKTELRQKTCISMHHTQDTQSWLGFCICWNLIHSSKASYYQSCRKS